MLGRDERARFHMNVLVSDSPALGLRWRWTRFAGLTPVELYEVLRLRQDIFIREQRCLYADIDGRDLSALHGLGTTPLGELVAHARLLPPAAPRDEPSIGRVAVALAWRAKGVGRELMLTALEVAEAEYPGRAVRVSAQAHLERFYASLGFTRLGPNYDDDGIPHCDMLRDATASLGAR